MIEASDYTAFDDTYIYANACLIADNAKHAIKAKRLHIHTSSFWVPCDDFEIDTSGAAGEPNLKPGDNPIDGGNAYSFFFSTSDMEPSSWFNWKGCGGQGGEGFSGVKLRRPGGNGGKGGNGAIGYGWSQDRFSNLLREAEEFKSAPTTTARNQMVEEWFCNMPKPVPARWVSESLVTSLATATDEFAKKYQTLGQEDFTASLSKILAVLQDLRTSFGSMKTWDCSRGMGGLPGEGIPTPGRMGSFGSKGGYFVPRELDSYSIHDSNECLFHPEQIAKTIREAENYYLVGTNESMATAYRLFKMVTDRLGFLDSLSSTHAIVEAYRSQERSLFVLPSTTDEPASIVSLRSSRSLAQGYTQQFANGLDFFGHEKNWAPRGSRKLYEEQLDMILDGFKDVERTYQCYQQAASDIQKRGEQIDYAKAAANASCNHATADCEDLLSEMKLTEHRIAGHQDQLPERHAALDKAIEEVADKIKNSFNISFSQFVSAASQIAFCPSEAMFAVQGLALFNDALTKVTDDSGVEVDKTYVVNKVCRIKADMNGLKEALAIGAGGDLTVDDPGATKLLAKEDDMKDLINNYHNLLGDSSIAHVQKLFDEYINTVIDRNNQIMHYNACLALWFQARDKARASEQALQDLNAEGIAEIDTELPGLATLVERSYFDLTKKVMQTLSSAQKSLNFWSLASSSQSTDELSSLRHYGNEFPACTPSSTAAGQTGLYSALVTARDNILFRYGQAVEHFGSDHSAFGLNGIEPIIVNLTQGQLLTLTGPERTTFAVSFRLKEVYRTTTREESPFSGWADVRLARARLFLEGAKTKDGILSVRLQHMGSEKIVDRENVMHEYHHDAIDLNFAYDLQSGKVHSDGVIAEEGMNEESLYAMPGPFCLWRVSVPTISNMGLDLSGVSKGWLEFSGYHRVFEGLQKERQQALPEPSNNI